MFSSGEGLRKRACAGAATTMAAAALAALPGAAQAQESTMCQNLWGGPMPEAVEFQVRSAGLGITNMGMSQAVAEALGAQYGNLWINDQRRGWSVAIAPGALDLDAAKAAISDRLAAHYDPAQAAFLQERLSVWSTPYADADLRAVQGQVFAALKTIDQGWGLMSSTTCVPAEGEGGVDAWRVEATLYTGEMEPSPELVARAQALVEPFGAKVRLKVTRGDGRVWPTGGGVPGAPAPVVTPQPPAAQPPGARPLPALSVSRYVSAPKANRCVRGRTITVTARRRADLRRLKVAARARTVTLRAGKSARIRLTSKRTKLKLTVTLRDGRTAVRQVTLRRCGLR